MKIAGTVVLYNPNESVIQNIKTYLPLVEKLYVVNNSTKAIAFIDEILCFDKVEYIDLAGNQGIAKALKIATEKAVEQGYDYILSMDQDSKFPTEDFDIVQKTLENIDYNQVGAVAVNNDAVKTRGGNNKNLLVEKPWVITSGCFMSTKAYASTVGYNEDLFIDGVDVDICYQIARAGFKFYLLENIFLQHQVGDECRTFKLFGHRIMSLFTHAPVRYYYQFRNFTYLCKIHRGEKGNIFAKEYALFKTKLLIKVFCLESHKRQVFKMIKQGIRDGKKGILGPYKERK